MVAVLWLQMVEISNNLLLQLSRKLQLKYFETLANSSGHVLQLLVSDVECWNTCRPSLSRDAGLLWML